MAGALACLRAAPNVKQNDAKQKLDENCLLDRLTGIQNVANTQISKPTAINWRTIPARRETGGLTFLAGGLTFLNGRLQYGHAEDAEDT